LSYEIKITDHPTINENRSVFHEIGVTGGRVEKRIANTKLAPLFIIDKVVEKIKEGR